MSADAIARVTSAFKARLQTELGPDTVYVGPPIPTEVGERMMALFLFHLEPNRDLRNEVHLVQEGVNQPLVVADALPLNLRYLLSVFRTAGAGGVADANELGTLGRVVQVLHGDPTLVGSHLPGQVVRLTPEPYPMEELSRVWGLFDNANYQTSMVYLASPVFVALDPAPRGAEVVERSTATGPFVEGLVP